ncbi:hypothetical protein ALI144C_06685 [Actinosynnema sp. ALI-1.44]|nr:hypothetical protein ALI144C_06685 [Actinosynnema sp. ALI-1.44]
MTEWCPDDVLVVRIVGDIDTDTSRTFDHYLRTRLPAEARHVVVDLSRVDVLGARGVRTLVEHTARLTSQGRRLFTVVSSPKVRRVLGAAHAAEDLRLFQSLPLAIAASESPGEVTAEPPEAVDTTGLQEEIYGLREALRTRPVVARALGVVQERYRLPDSAATFGLLRESAQRHNIRLYTLARALLEAHPPHGQVWFPGRARRPAPSLSFVAQQPQHRGNRSAVLNSLLEAATCYMQASAASVRLADGLDDALRLELTLNVSPALADRLASSENPATAEEKAAVAVVPDVTAAPGLADDIRCALLDAGIQATQSTPLLSDERKFFGVLTTYHAERGFAPSRLQCARLEHAATEVATWLDWHARTVMLDALEHIHTGAVQRSRQ